MQRNLRLLLMLAAALCTVTAARAAEQSEGADGAPQFPQLTGRVVDDAEILSPAAEATLTRELAAFEQQSGGTQIVVATLPSLQGRTIEEYGFQLGRHWGIGQRDEDTGALLLVAPEQRRVRIEVGYGLEGELTDAISSDIIQRRILPRFADGDFDAGVLDGARAMVAALGGSYQPAAAPAARQPGEQDERRFAALGFWIFVIFILLSSFGSKRRGSGRFANAILAGALLGGMRGGRGGFGGGGGGFGGGFGGGGGGFGGGGASGGW